MTDEVQIASAVPRHRTWQLWMGIANVMSCFAVIVLHFNSFWAGPSQGDSFLSAVVIETCFDWAVPVFLMLSGANLIGYRARMSTREYAKRRVTKTVVPFVFWSLFAMVFDCVVHAVPMRELTPLGIVAGIVNFRYCSIYWFFAPLFVMYACIPFFSLMDRRDEAFAWLAALAFVFGSLLPLVSAITGLRLDNRWYPPIVGGYLIYLFLGHLVCNTDLLDRWRRIVYAAAVAACVAKVSLIYGDALDSGQINSAYTASLGPFNVLLSVAVLLAFKNFKYGGRVLTRSGFKNAVRWLTSKTFGVYLVHFYLREMADAVFPDVVRYTLWYRTGGAVLAFCLCVLLVALLQKIPLAKRVLP